MRYEQTDIWMRLVRAHTSGNLKGHTQRTPTRDTTSFIGGSQNTETVHTFMGAVENGHWHASTAEANQTQTIRLLYGPNFVFPRHQRRVLVTHAADVERTHALWTVSLHY